jgi:hypothetical protein
MTRTAVLSMALAASLLAMPAVAASNSSFMAFTQAGQVTPQQAAPFIGDWTLALQGPNGPGTFAVSLKVEKEKVVGEVSSDQLPKLPVTSISMADKNLVLGYSFTWEGNPVEAVITLTPGTEAKTAAQIDFAGGAYVMTGTATKKEKAGL